MQKTLLFCALLASAAAKMNAHGGKGRGVGAFADDDAATTTNCSYGRAGGGGGGFGNGGDDAVGVNCGGGGSGGFDLRKSGGGVAMLSMFLLGAILAVGYASIRKRLPCAPPARDLELATIAPATLAQVAYLDDDDDRPPLAVATATAKGETSPCR
jgi:hypothetical protein